MDVVRSAEEPRRRRRAAAAGPQPSEEQLAELQLLYDRGRIYDAYRLTLPLAPMRDWRSPDARILAGRLAHHLGAPLMADAIMILAWRRAPRHTRARYFGIRALLSRRGPLEALQALERLEAPKHDPREHAEWLALHGHILGAFRDFARAEALLAEARAIAPDHHWIALESASLLGMQDRLEEALEEARRGFTLQPLHPGSSTAQAQILLLLGREDEAIGVLEAAMELLQSSAVASFLAPLLTARERYSDSLQAWEVCQVLMPLMEPPLRTWLHSNLSHMQYLLGNIDEAKRLAIASGDPFLAEVAGRLDEKSFAHHTRMKLEVPFIKQHHVTCVPTTMAMIGRYWGEDLEHLAIAEQITYGGTATHRERSWAEAHGWIVPEFTMTWDAAVAVLDRGVPFTLTTSSGDQGHEQAVVGYDTHRRSLLIRDPSTPSIREMDVDSLLRIERANGPRAMIMLPQREAHRLEGLTLPESSERDIRHRMMLALDRHDRAVAQRLADSLPGGADESARNSLAARHTLAMYDSDVMAMLRVIDETLQIFPDDTTLLMQKQQCLAHLSRNAERLKLLQRLAIGQEGHPIFIRIYAEALSASAEDHEKALVHLRRYLRNVTIDAEALRVMANVVWSEQRAEEAAALYRLAAASAETNESFASSYFIAAALVGKQEEALDFLRDRARRASGRSGLPSQTLFWALSQVFRIDEAFQVLDAAIAQRAEDGDLLLFAAESSTRYGRNAAADELLRKAEPLARKVDYLSTRGTIRALRGELQGALADWMKVFELQPLSADAHSSICELLRQTAGTRAVIDFLERLIERFPGYRHAYTLLATAARDDAALHERAVRRLLDIAPDDPWAHRELAMQFAFKGQFDEALAEAQRAEEIAPADPSARTVRGRILQLAGRDAEARAAYLDALDLYSDDEFAIASLGAIATDGKDRERLYIDVFETIVTRTPYGEGILTWYEAAEPAIAPEKMLELAEGAAARRGQFWQAHSILIRQLLRSGRTREAVKRAEEATSRFAMQSVLWCDAAAAFRAAGDATRAAAAYETALHLSPTMSAPAIDLAFLLRSAGDHDRADAVLETASAAAPLDATVQWMLAEAYWRRANKEEALARFVRAAKLLPDNGPLWETLVARGTEAGRPEIASETAAQLVDEKPGNVAAWLALARAERELDGRLAAIQQAISIDPQDETPHHRRAETLVAAARYEEAAEACRSLKVGDRVPIGLRAREAWVWAQSGDFKRAISLMSEIVRVEPGYSWGWLQLAQWYSATEQPQEYRRAAMHLVKLEDQSTAAWNHLAQAELALRNMPRAEECLARSLDLDPADFFAVMTMVDLQMSKNALARAREILGRAAAADPNPAFRARQADVAFLGEAKDEGLRYLRDLLVDPSVDPDMIKQVMRSAQPYATEIGALLDWALRKDTVNPAAAEEKVRMLLERKKRDEALALIAKLPEHAKAAAGSEYLNQAGTRRDAKAFKAFVERFPQWAAEDMTIWGMIGYCRLNLEQHQLVVAEMSNWQQRSGVMPWMVFNLAISFREMGRPADAMRTHEAALSLPEDGTTNSHTIWLALDYALEGRLAEADALISRTRLEQADLQTQMAGRLAWALVASERMGDNPEWRYAAGEQLNSVIAAAKAGQLTRTTKRLYAATVRALQKRRSGFFTQLWLWNLRMKV